MTDEASAIGLGAKESSPRARLLKTLGAVVVGAVITGLASYIVASQQAEATIQEALRTQRLMAYSQFMADKQELKYAHLQFVESLVKKPVRQSREFVAVIKKPVDDAMSKVIKDVSMVSLIGSVRAAAIANEPLLHHNRTSSRAGRRTWFWIRQG
jgi:hypothetical protein